MMTYTNFLLNLKALIISIFVSYTEESTNIIADSLRKGILPADHKIQDSHLGNCLKSIIEDLPDKKDRDCLATALSKVKHSRASTIYQNMVIELAHYVTAEANVDDIPEDTPGVIYNIKDNKIGVIFRLSNRHLKTKIVHPFQIMPIYTLTIPDPTKEN